MGRRSKKRNRETKDVGEPGWFNWWPGIIAVGCFVFAFLMTFVIYEITPDDKPSVENLPDGGQRFLVATLRSIIIGPAFLGSLVVSFVLAFCWPFLRTKLREEQARNRPWEKDAWERATRLQRIVGWTWAVTKLTLLAATFIGIPLLLLWTTVYVVEVHEQHVTIKTLVSAREIPAEKILEAERTREVDDNKVIYEVRIRLRGGGVAATRNPKIDCPQPGSPEDERLDALFSQLARAINNVRDRAK